MEIVYKNPQSYQESYKYGPGGKKTASSLVHGSFTFLVVSGLAAFGLGLQPSFLVLHAQLGLTPAFVGKQVKSFYTQDTNRRQKKISNVISLKSIPYI